MTRTVAPSTVTNGRLSVVPGAAIVVVTAQALAPRGRRQKCSEVTLLSGPYHAMYAVPAGSTATPGLWPAPIVTGVAAPAAGASGAASVDARSALTSTATAPAQPASASAPIGPALSTSVLAHAPPT